MKSFLFSHRGAMGDFILTWPTLLALRTHFHDCRFVGLGKPDHMQMAKEFCLVDDFYDCESAALLPFYSGEEWPAFLGTVEGAVLWMESDSKLQSMLESKCKGVSVFHSPFPKDDRHVMDYHLSLLEKFSLPIPSESEVYMPLKTSRGKYALIHPGSGKAEKNYAAEFYAFIAQELKSTRFPDVRIVLGPNELDLQSIFEQRFTIEKPQSCLDLAQLIANSALFIGNDSGVSHLAAITGTKTLGLYKDNNHRQWGLRGKQAQCLEAASEAQAMTRIQRVLKELEV